MMNKHNKKTLTSLKKLLKPILRVLKKKQYNSSLLSEILDNRSNQSLEDQQRSMNESDYQSEQYQNNANEALEDKLLEELEYCQKNSAIWVFQSNSDLYAVPVTSEQKYIPVHFAKTNKGTFFWTSQKSCCSDSMTTSHCSMEAIAVPSSLQDRWVQA